MTNQRTSELNAEIMAYVLNQPDGKEVLDWIIQRFECGDCHALDVRDCDYAIYMWGLSNKWNMTEYTEEELGGAIGEYLQPLIQTREERLHAWLTDIGAIDADTQNTPMEGK